MSLCETISSQGEQPGEQNGQVETAFESLARRNRISRNKMETSVFLGKLRVWPRTRGNFGFKSTTSTVEYVRTRHGYLVT